MALSNIFREPRREITESVLGIVPLGIFLYADYRFALWFHEMTGGGVARNGAPWGLGMVIGGIITGVFVVALFATHALGETICDSLARRGIELRPRRH